MAQARYIVSPKSPSSTNNQYLYTMTQDDLVRTLKLARIPGDASITITFANGAKQVIRPSKAFGGEWKPLCDAVAGGEPYTVSHN